MKRSILAALFVAAIATVGTATVSQAADSSGTTVTFYVAPAPEVTTVLFNGYWWTSAA